MSERIRPRRKRTLRPPPAPPALNPELREAVLALVEDQLAKNDPPEMRQTLERLVGMGYPRASAHELLAHVIVLEMFDVMARGERYDRARYIAALERLPQLGDAD
jgi:hypothetical protein